jgi:hypothetical protein
MGANMVVYRYTNFSDRYFQIFLDIFTDYLSFRESDILNNPEEPIFCGSMDPATNTTSVHDISQYAFG